MATYLQGVTDYIPDYQPFQPDLNFYANVLQTKQTQYDSNWKSLNNLYADLHNADLTHDQNIKKKDDLLKQIDFNLKRVTGLDLSLQQNVDQATQVFRPFYEDKYLMKDMAWTKNYSNTVSRALNLRNAQDEKMRAQYWDTGVKEMQYRREEFKNSTLEETLNMGNVSYTPYVNAMEKYLKLAKETGLSIDIKDVDESGLYFVREKNGKALMSPLQNLFMSAYANDPALRAVYATQSYVKRKDYAEQYASKFQGNKVEAEKEYLREQYKFLQNYTAKKNVDAKESVEVSKNKAADVENAISNKDAGIYTESYLESLNKGLEVDETVANHAEKLNNDINGGTSSTITTSATSTDPNQLDMSDMDLARLRVDAGTASVLAEQDIIGAAYIYAYKDYVYEKSANPVGLENLRQQNALARIDYTHQLKQDEMKLKADLDRETNRIKQGMSDGTIWYDKEGEMHEDDGSSFAITLGSPSGSFTDEINILKDNSNRYNETISNMTGTYIGNTLTRLKNLADNGKVKDKELWSALSWLDPNSKEAAKRYGTKDGKVLLDKLWNKYQNNSDKFILDFTKTNQVIKLKKFMDSWANKNTGYGIADDYHKDVSGKDIEKYIRYRDQSSIIDKANHDKISNNIIKSLDANSYFKNLKSETKQKLADLYIKKVKSGSQLDEDTFQTFVDQNINYDRTGKYKTAFDKSHELVLGAEGNKKYNSYIAEESKKWNDKNFWKSPVGKQIAQSPAGAAVAFNKYLDTKAKTYLNQNMTDEGIRKLLSKEVWRSNEALAKRYGKGSAEYKKRALKSPYDYTDAELAKAKQNYAKNSTRLPINLGESKTKVAGRVAFSEQTGLDMEDLFDTMSDAYLKTINQTGDAGLKSYAGFVRTQGGRYSLGTNEVTAKKVILSNPSFGGFQDFQEIMADINRIRFSQDPSKYAVTYGGLTETAANDYKLDTSVTKAMLRELQMSAGSKSKTGAFMIARSAIAREKADLGAVIIIPPQAFLEKYIKDEEGKTDYEKIKMIKANGISFIAPRQQWTNNFFQENELTPTEQVLNAKGKIEFVHGEGAGRYTMEKVRNVPGVDYRISHSVKRIHEEGYVEELSDGLPLQKSGNKIDASESAIYDKLQEIALHNAQMVRQFQRQGNQAALTRIKTSFNKPPVGGYQY